MYSNISSLNILYIEDDSFILKTFKQVFEYLGASVVGASSYDEAVRVFNYGNNNFNLIIVDIELNGIFNGLDFVHLVKTFNKTIKVIITSGYDHTEYLIKAIELKVDKYFIKPFKEVLLFEYLNKLSSSIDEESTLKINTDNLISLTNKFYYSYTQKCFLKENSTIHLTIQESFFVELLLKNKSQTVPYEIIAKEFKNKFNKQINKVIFRTIIKNIRKKTTYEIFKLIPNIGYKIVSN
jgi:DNA-binding response OmpR family regulator